ncbi:MAG: DciA family protein [Burkholderiales bacterium]|nr:DciA family protein [Burkholderiales bacterium]
MPSTQSFNPLARVIETEPRLAVWLRRHRLEAALTHTVRAHLPRLIAGQVRVTDVRGEHLELTVPSGALATAVHQQIPELLMALASHSREFNGILIRVQPLAAFMSASAPLSRRPPPVTAPLQTLVRSLSNGPLKDAVSRLIKQR